MDLSDVNMAKSSKYMDTLRIAPLPPPRVQFDKTARCREHFEQVDEWREQTFLRKAPMIRLGMKPVVKTTEGRLLGLSSKTPIHSCGSARGIIPVSKPAQALVRVRMANFRELYSVFLRPNLPLADSAEIKPSPSHASLRSPARWS